MRSNCSLRNEKTEIRLTIETISQVSCQRKLLIKKWKNESLKEDQIVLMRKFLSPNMVSLETDKYY